MKVYIGYGFDAEKISDAEMLEIIRKYEPDMYNRIIQGLQKEWGYSEEEAVEAVSVYDNDYRDYRDCYYNAAILERIINKNEAEAAGTDNIVAFHDEYLVFESIQFASDDGRAKYIKSKEDFIQMIARYVPTEGLHFGSLYKKFEDEDSTYYDFDV